MRSSRYPESSGIHACGVLSGTGGWEPFWGGQPDKQVTLADQSRMNSLKTRTPKWRWHADLRWLSRWTRNDSRRLDCQQSPVNLRVRATCMGLGPSVCWLWCHLLCTAPEDGRSSGRYCLPCTPPFPQPLASRMIAAISAGFVTYIR